MGGRQWQHGEAHVTHRGDRRVGDVKASWAVHFDPVFIERGALGAVRHIG